MKIESKYNIGDRIWVVYENQGEVSVYEDTISEIVINENGIIYISGTTCIDINEEDIILYDDREGLANKIIETMNEIHKKEEEENV